MVTIYAEKASLAKTIATALGAGNRIANPKDKFTGHWEFDFNGEAAVIVHGVGHLAGLAPPEFYDIKYKNWSLDNYPIFPKNYTVLIDTSKTEIINLVGKYLNESDWIINACDPDREGELIFAYVLETLKIKKPWKRAILTDLTENTIIQAFSALKESEEMLPLQYAGRARAIADWLFGMNLTVATNKKYGSFSVKMPVGRVQTATLAMVANREKAVVNHIKTPFWKITADFKNFTAHHKNGNFEDKKQAEKVFLKVQGKSGTVTKKTQKNRFENPPLLYNSTGLQVVAINTLGFELPKITEIIQKLYEKGLITYPRTSSEHLTDEMRENVKNTISKLFSLKEYEKYKIENYAEFTKRHFDNEKVGSHTAIIPTGKVPLNLQSLSDNEKAIYDLIVKSVLKIALGKAEFVDTELEIAVEKEIFIAKNSIEKTT
jgi:DNA topoisomerase-3